MRNHILFLYNVFVHLVASMSGLASFAFGFYEHLQQRKIASRVFFAVGSVLLIVAFDQAWQDEHWDVEVLIGEKSTLWQERDFWKEQSYQKDSTVRQMNGLLDKTYGVLFDTQQSMTKLSDKILDLNKPEPQQYSVRADHVDFPTVSAGQNSVEIIVSTNKPHQADFTMTCQEPIVLRLTSLAVARTMQTPSCKFLTRSGT